MLIWFTSFSDLNRLNILVRAWKDAVRKDRLCATGAPHANIVVTLSTNQHDVIEIIERIGRMNRQFLVYSKKDTANFMLIKKFV